MKILIAGADGFVGKNILGYFRANCCHEIFTYTRDNPCIPVGKVDTVIHCAAELRNESKMFDSNVKLTYSLLNVARYDHFIHIGSSAEYNAKDQTLYAATKRAASALVDRDSRAAVVYPWSLYGPGDREDKLHAAMYRAWKNKEQMKFYPYGVHDWVFIDDLIKVIVDIVENKRTGAFDVGTGINTTNMLLMDTFCRVVGGNVSYDAMDTFYSKHDCLEWPGCGTPLDTFIGLEEGVRRYVQWRESKETHT